MMAARGDVSRIGGVILIIASVLTSVAWAAGMWTHLTSVSRLSEAGVRTSARVVALEGRWDREVHLRFRAGGGQVDGSVHYPWRSPRQGADVPVVHDPADPGLVLPVEHLSYVHAMPVRLLDLAQSLGVGYLGLFVFLGHLPRLHRRRGPVPDAGALLPAHVAAGHFGEVVPVSRRPAAQAVAYHVLGDLSAAWGTVQLQVFTGAAARRRIRRARASSGEKLTLRVEAYRTPGQVVLAYGPESLVRISAAPEPFARRVRGEQLALAAAIARRYAEGVGGAG